MTRRQGLAAVVAEMSDWRDDTQVTVALGDLRGAVAVINGLHTELRRAHAALERIEMDAQANPAEWAAVDEHGTDAAGQLTDQQIIAAAARHRIGGNDHG